LPGRGRKGYHMRQKILAVAFLAASAAGEALYEFSNSPLVQLEDGNFESMVTKDDRHMWVVEYYADWCGHCKQFAKGFQKAAANLDGLVKFGAVNADNSKKTATDAGVQGYPSVKLYLPGSGGRNPYTGKPFKPAVDYNGPRSAKGVVEFAMAQLPSLVVPVTDKTLAGFKGNGSLPKMLLFTEKTETAPLLKSLSLAFNGRMLVGEARSTASKVTADFGVSDFPKVVVMPAGGEPIKYDGEIKPAALSAFLETHAAEAPAPAAADKASDGGSAAAQDDLAVAIDESNVAELVEGERDAWMLVFAGTEVADLPSPGVGGLAEALYGQLKVGRASADLASRYGVTVGASPSVVVYPFRQAGVKRKALKFTGNDEGLAKAKKAALESLPDTYVEKVSQANVDQFMQQGMMTSESKAFCILFSDKPTVPPLFRALSLAFEGKLGFGMGQAAETGLASRFNVKKAPTLLVMFPDEDKVDEKTGQVPLTGMQFMPQAHGKFNFGNIANFLGQVVQMRAQKAGGSAEGASGGAAEPTKRESGADLKGPLPELSSDTFDKECVSKGGLCAIALLDGAAENSASKEGQLQMLTKLRKRKAGSPLSFSWLDATCHTGFAAAFGLSEMDLPTMIFVSPTKLRWARAVGAFDAETLGGFGSLVAAGKKATETLDALPTLEDVDCATMKRGAAAYEEVDDGADDIMAEILEEERREREAREAEMAAEGIAAAADGGGGK